MPNENEYVGKCGICGRWLPISDLFGRKAKKSYGERVVSYTQFFCKDCFKKIER